MALTKEQFAKVRPYAAKFKIKIVGAKQVDVLIKTLDAIEDEYIQAKGLGEAEFNKWKEDNKDVIQFHNKAREWDVDSKPAKKTKKGNRKPKPKAKAEEKKETKKEPAKDLKATREKIQKAKKDAAKKKAERKLASGTELDEFGFRKGSLRSKAMELFKTGKYTIAEAVATGEIGSPSTDWKAKLRKMEETSEYKWKLTKNGKVKITKK